MARAIETVDAVVVGSGFGGSVVALRLAEAGYDVVLLERGQRYPPGSFPRSPSRFARNLWDPSEGLQGLFDLWSFRHIEAVVSSGLGGGSLIYANVLLRKDERWFVTGSGPSGGYESWPVTRADLDPFYDLAEKTLGVQGNRYPHTDVTPKTQAMRKAAQDLGLDWFRPPLAISFGQRPGEPILNGEPNLHGVTRLTCRLCGECNLGCNSGSKNTLDYTYLSYADRAGADLRDRCEARTIVPCDGGYEIGYVRHEPENEGVRLDTARLPVRTLRAKVVIMAAGALGTSFLLLRNQKNLPGLGPALGTRFSGNGDLLAFVRRASQPLEPSRGPVITSTIRVPDAIDGDGEGRGFYLQEGGYPEFLDWLVELSGVGGTAKRLASAAATQVLTKLTGTPRSQISAEVSAVLGDGRRSSGSLPLLGMGRDVPDGRLRLRHGLLDVDWCEATSKPYLDRLTATMAAVAKAMGGRLQLNPTRRFHRLITVHPLGGCPMSTDQRSGVIDSYGESFGHPGLFVADGAAMPGPVGANPSLTIAALAERFSTRVIERLGKVTR